MKTGKTILCAVDLSLGSERVVAQASELAQLMAAELQLLYVYRAPVLPLEEWDPEDGESEVVHLLRRVERELTVLGEPSRASGLKVDVLMLEGDASDTILRQSERVVASMIVVGTHGRSGFKHFVLGSTAERVVRMSPVPVVTVRIGT
jgi:nucleotide-binding universal stress UspA family protein